MSADLPVGTIDTYFFKPFEEYPRCITMEAIVIGEGVLTPSLIRRTAEIAATGNLGYNFTFVGNRVVKEKGARADFLLGMQVQSGLAPPMDGETESRYMLRLFQSEIAQVKGRPEQFEPFVYDEDKSQSVDEQVHLALRSLDLPVYADITPKSGDSVAVAVVCTPWLMPRVLTAMRAQCDKMGRSHCFVPYPVWPIEANMLPDEPRREGTPMPMYSWKNPFNPTARVGFVDQFKIIASANSHGYCLPLDIRAEALRVEGHINIHRGTYLAPAA